MKDDSSDISTHGPVFAVLLIILVIVVLGYNALQGVLRTNSDAPPSNDAAEIPATPDVLDT